MSKVKFKVGDKVYHIEYGWGIVHFSESINFPILVEFGKEEIFSFTLDGRETNESKQSLLSFTEYTLQEFSQERKIELPEIGELCLVRDDEAHTWKVREFEFEHDGIFFVKSLCGNTDGYVFLKRIKILD